MENIVSENRNLHRISGVESYANLRNVYKSAGPVSGMSYQPFGFIGADVEVWPEIPYYPHMEFINDVQNPYYGRKCFEMMWQGCGLSIKLCWLYFERRYIWSYVTIHKNSLLIRFFHS